MKAFEVLTNLKGFDCWDFKNYSLSKEEAATIIELLEKPKGKWLSLNELDTNDDRWVCSHCGNIIHARSKMDLYTFYSWCGRCGTCMREEVEERTKGEPLAEKMKIEKISDGIKIYGEMTESGKKFLKEIELKATDMRK